MKLLLHFSLALAILTSATFAQPDEVLYDGFREMSGMERKVRDVVEVKRDPLFDNAPFLRLRGDDKLVKARRDFSGERTKPAADPDRVDFYLQSGGHFFDLPAREKDGKVLLVAVDYAAICCLLFDWDITLENARALRELLPSEYSESLTTEQFDAILSAIAKEFPEARESAHRDLINLKPPHVLSIPGQTEVEFKGLSFYHFRDCLYSYTVRMGHSNFLITGRRVLQGPGHVEKWEFENHNYTNVLNAGAYEINPATAKLKKAEYEKMHRFEELLFQAIGKKLPWY